MTDLDLALIESKLDIPDSNSSVAHKVRFENRKGNRLSLMLTKRSPSDTIHGSIFDNEKAKDFMDAIGENFKELGKE